MTRFAAEWIIYNQGWRWIFLVTAALAAGSFAMLIKAPVERFAAAPSKHARVSLVFGPDTGGSSISPLGGRSPDSLRADVLEALGFAVSIFGPFGFGVFTIEGHGEWTRFQLLTTAAAVVCLAAAASVGSRAAVDGRRRLGAVSIAVCAALFAVIRPIFPLAGFGIGLALGFLEDRALNSRTSYRLGMSALVIGLAVWGGLEVVARADLVPDGEGWTAPGLWLGLIALAAKACVSFGAGVLAARQAPRGLALFDLRFRSRILAAIMSAAGACNLSAYAISTHVGS